MAHGKLQLKFERHPRVRYSNRDNYDMVPRTDGLTKFDIMRELT